ncbi:MAG: phosphoribosylformylglycinamidine synthase, partial [Pseudomonadota bacterium]|nr:phosphoribosylformylglycinamidine synthase [Pseudomonadota bacterium]
DLSVIFGKPPALVRKVSHKSQSVPPLNFADIQLKEALFRVLELPVVSDKSFLITIGDRTVGGLTHRDQMVGPWQIPVSDVAVTVAGFRSFSGEAMAMGERAPIALINGPASGRMAVAEAITNIAAASIESLGQIKLSANWMAASGFEGEDAVLYDTVQALGMEFCPALGLSIPVGKDSLSMKTVWSDRYGEKAVVSPLSLIVSAFAPVVDIRCTLTPQLLDDDQTLLYLIDLGEGRNRLGGSAITQVYNQLGDDSPDIEDPKRVISYFNAIQAMNRQNLLLAYHDRSDGGMIVTLCEMMFASHLGVTVDLSSNEVLGALFSEEAGAVIQVRSKDVELIEAILVNYGIQNISYPIGTLNHDDRLIIRHQGDEVLNQARINLVRSWSKLSFKMQSLRDNPECAAEAYQLLLDEQNKGLQSILTFDSERDISTPYLSLGARPLIAILREQGVNGHVEMAAAFDAAGFTAVDVHMSDILSKRVVFDNFHGLVACGGFSYGDVLGAGAGWARSILFNEYVLSIFEKFFHRPDTFALGVCNGCQMMSHLAPIIPGAIGWPKFLRNRSEQFEARLVNVEIQRSPSIFFHGMEGSILPVVVSHGEGRVVHDNSMIRPYLVMRYVDSNLCPTMLYPSNPNGSPAGETGFTSEDGRFTILMPHPERGFRSVQFSWKSDAWGETSPWLRMFQNARAWVN